MACRYSRMHTRKWIRRLCVFWYRMFDVRSSNDLGDISRSHRLISRHCVLVRLLVGWLYVVCMVWTGRSKKKAGGKVCEMQCIV